MTKKIILSSLFACLLAIPLLAQKKSFTIRILQDSVYLPGPDNVIILRKKPFKILVELENLEGVHLYAAFKDSIYKTPDGQLVPGFKDIPPMSMAEESFNPEQELIISDDGWAYWFYDPKQDWHRFDKEIKLTGKTIIATKSVKQFYLPPAEKTLPVAEVTESLYLFFISAKENKKGELTNELQRYKVKINWQ